MARRRPGRAGGFMIGIGSSGPARVRLWESNAPDIDRFLSAVNGQVAAQRNRNVGIVLGLPRPEIALWKGRAGRSMSGAIGNKSIEFFESQFQHQVREQAYALNPFETLALNYLKGEVLDLGSGLGNLSLEAGRRGHSVLAVDASPTAVARINGDARQESLPVRAMQVDIEGWTIDRPYDTIVAIGLLMFFCCERARELLRAVQKKVKPGGRAIVNVLIEGTTYMGMFDPDHYCLFRRTELEESFTGWTLLEARYQTFPAPEETRKEFSTVIAEKPSRKAH